MPGLDYVEVRCKSALNRVEGLPFRWSLNPFAGCAHACQFFIYSAGCRVASHPVARRRRAEEVTWIRAVLPRVAR